MSGMFVEQQARGINAMQCSFQSNLPKEKDVRQRRFRREQRGRGRRSSCCWFGCEGDISFWKFCESTKKVSTTIDQQQQSFIFVESFPSPTNASSCVVDVGKALLTPSCHRYNIYELLRESWSEKLKEVSRVWPSAPRIQLPTYAYVLCLPCQKIPFGRYLRWNLCASDYLFVLDFTKHHIYSNNPIPNTTGSSCENLW